MVPGYHQTGSERISVESAGLAKAKVPVLVFGAGITTLGVIRSFGRAGITAYCVSNNLGIVARSRWCRRLSSDPKRISDPEELVPFLERLPFERAVLIPCADIWLGAMGSLPAELADRFPSSLPASDVSRLLVDKSRFASVLTDLDIAHPTTILLESEDQLRSLQVKDFTGCFLKPCDSFHFTTFYGIKACQIESRDDAIIQFRRITGDGFTMLFQEYIPGPPSNHYFIDGFVDRNGKICALFARRRLRMYPIDFGNSTCMVSIELSDVSEAVEAIKRLLTGIGYRGIFSAEFKFDERDSLYKILEINARPWWFVEFTVGCGVDVCTLAYKDALGLDVDTIDSYRVGAWFVHPYLDAKACSALHHKGELSLYSWAKSWLVARYPDFSLTDPVPALSWLSENSIRKIKKWIF